jgi:hypothetical protein
MPAQINFIANASNRVRQSHWSCQKQDNITGDIVTGTVQIYFVPRAPLYAEPHFCQNHHE